MFHKVAFERFMEISRMIKRTSRFRFPDYFENYYFAKGLCKHCHKKWNKDFKLEKI